jgi:hypothetical protein
VISSIKDAIDKNGINSDRVDNILIAKIKLVKQLFEFAIKHDNISDILKFIQKRCSQNYSIYSVSINDQNFPQKMRKENISKVIYDFNDYLEKRKEYLNISNLNDELFGDNSITQ